MSYQSDPNQPWGSPPAGDQPAGYPPSGYQPYPNQPYANQPGQPVLAGWWYRVGATIIDDLIIIVPAYIIGLAAGSRVLYYVLATLGQIVYATLLIGGGGRTVGMIAVGTKCVDAAGGITIGYGRGLLRWFVTFILGLTIIGGILDILWPLWDDKNQTIHDKAATSVVVLSR